MRAVSRLVVVLVVLTLGPLALLTYFSLSLAGAAVEREVEKRLQATAATSAVTVREELHGLTDLVESFAGRPTLRAAVMRGDRRAVAYHLRELQRARPGIFTAFAADLDGRLLEIVPATPAIVGEDFSYRDWYRGVRRTGSSYVSEAYFTRAAGQQPVVASATYVRTPSGRPIAILVGAYRVAHLQRLSDQIARAEGVTLRIIDHAGTLLARPDGVSELVSVKSDRRVVAGLAGRSGIGEFDTADGRRISAYTPVADLGWVVTASLPANTAFAAIGGLRSTVLTIAGILALVLLGALALFTRELRLRAKAEHEAVELAAINSAVLDSTIDSILMTDLDGKIVLRNRSLEELRLELGETGNGSDSLTEGLSSAAERTTDPAGFRAAVEGLVQDRERRLLYEFELAEARRSFQLFSAPVSGRDGEPMGRILSFHEVTREREADRLKADLLATVSHELRTPLTGVLGFAELARRPNLDAAKRDRYLTTIHGEAKRLTALVNDFLDLQRIEAGAFTLALESLDLRDLLVAEAELFEGRSELHTMTLELPSEPLVVSGDRERLAQVLENLLSNAFKYSPAGGTVRLSAESIPGYVRVSVSDEGLGIPADQQSHVFTKFFRVDTSDTRRIGGTGLGLALCREMIEAHAGEIGVDTDEGSGSTFWFTLPAGQRQAAQGSARILVIEDDPTAASFLVEALSAEGFAVETASNGDDGLRRALEEPPAVICLDMFLPNGIQGWEVLERVKADERTAHVPVVVCTGRNNRDRAAALGASDFLAKPLSPQQLHDAVRRLVRPPAQVLVIDDDPTVRRLVVETLSGGALEIAEAADGREGLDAINERRPDVIVLDLMMPEIDGFEVLEHLQRDADLRTIPVIVLTARRLSAEERRAVSERATALLGKSEYSAEELHRLVVQAMGARDGDLVAVSAAQAL